MSLLYQADSGPVTTAPVSVNLSIKIMVINAYSINKKPDLLNSFYFLFNELDFINETWQHEKQVLHLLKLSCSFLCTLKICFVGEAGQL